MEFTTLPTDTPASPNGGTDASVTSVPQPPGVPETAEAIARTTTLGEITRTANEPPTGNGTRQLIAVPCRDDVASLVTSEETIYMALTCDNFLAPGTAEVFIAKEVAIVLDVGGGRLQVSLETLGGAQAQFFPAGIWLE